MAVYVVGDFLRETRMRKGYTQEELAIKLNVVRQTVSKWEKGLSVPDADVLCKIADVLDTDVSTLLGEEIVEETDKSAVAQQLAKISEQLAMKNQHSKKIWKVVCIILFVILVFYILAIVVFSVIASENIVDNYSENMVEIEEK